MHLRTVTLTTLVLALARQPSPEPTLSEGFEDTDLTGGAGTTATTTSRSGMTRRRELHPKANRHNVLCRSVFTAMATTAGWKWAGNVRHQVAARGSR